MPAEASAIYYSSSDHSFLQTPEEQTHLKMDASRLLPTTDFKAVADSEGII